MWKYHVFVRKLPWYFNECTHLPLLIVFKKLNILQHQDYPILGTVFSQEIWVPARYIGENPLLKKYSCCYKFKYAGLF